MDYLLHGHNPWPWLITALCVLMYLGVGLFIVRVGSQGGVIAMVAHNAPVLGIVMLIGALLLWPIFPFLVRGILFVCEWVQDQWAHYRARRYRRQHGLED